MEMLWNLDKLYKSFEDEKLEEDIVKAEGLLKSLEDRVTEALDENDTSMDTLEWFIDKSNELGDLFGNVFIYAQLVYSVDTTNNQALKVIERAEKYLPAFAVFEVKYTKWLKTLNNIEYKGIVKDHKFSIEETLKQAKHMLDDKSEMIIATLRNTGSSAWDKLQETMVSSLSVDIDGKKLPLPAVRNMAYDKSADVRKKAFEAELAAYPAIEKSSAASLNAIKGEVIEMVKLRGYETPLEMTLQTSRMDRETLDAMITAMKEYLPDFRRYLRKKANMLGYEGGLPFYDLFAPVGGADKEYTFKEARDFIVKNFSSFSSELGNYAANAFDNNWIDAKIRDGKVGGAFCANIHGIRESRIMSNFSGVFSDVTTLAHELGHGYHGHCLRDATNTNSNYPMPLAETASIFCESIVMNAALKEANHDESTAILEHSLLEATQVIVDILSRYIFETELFEKRKEGSLSTDELKDAMVRAQKEAYGDGLDENALHPYMWACKTHYYNANRNFYNFPYAFGLLFAKGLYAMYMEEGESFIEKYDKLLYETGKNDIRGVLSTVGVDSGDIDFWRKSLELIKKDVDKFCSL
jgi:pepF/M3 family oligoendopeptidase